MVTHSTTSSAISSAAALQPAFPLPARHLLAAAGAWPPPSGPWQTRCQDLREGEEEVTK